MTEKRLSGRQSGKSVRYDPLLWGEADRKLRGEDVRILSDFDMDRGRSGLCVPWGRGTQTGGNGRREAENPPYARLRGGRISARNYLGGVPATLC